MTDKRISVVAPVFNEAQNIGPLHQALVPVLEAQFKDWEMIYIDDGSTDGSFPVLEELRADDPRVKLIKFTRNFGQTAALSAGIDLARFETILTIDADLQNDPGDIPALVTELDKGFALVCGWRKNRKDHLIRRKIPSWTANRIISWFSNVRLHDYGCTLKAMSAEYIKRINLYGEMHRFIPALVSREGGRVTEMEVAHHPRLHGSSKYGLERIFKVVLDLVVLKFLSGYVSRPIHFFGALSFVGLGLSFLIALFTLYVRYVLEVEGLLLTPMLILIMMLVILSFLSLLIGLLGEISIRIYYESQGKKPYVVEKTMN